MNAPPSIRLELASCIALAGILAGPRGDLPYHVVAGEAIAAAAELLRRLDGRTLDPTIPAEDTADATDDAPF